MNNPMKPAAPAENEENTIKFESEETAKFAAEIAEKEGIDLATLEGTGDEDAITLDDLQAAIDAKENAGDGETPPPANETDKINFASDDAAEYAHEVKDKIDITKVVGTGKKDGGITKGDIKLAVQAIEKAEAAAEAEKAAAATPAEKSNDDEGEGEDDAPATVESVLESLISFGIPVRGALNTKPKVQEAWNALIADAVKVRKAL